MSVTTKRLRRDDTNGNTNRHRASIAQISTTMLRIPGSMCGVTSIQPIAIQAIPVSATNSSNGNVNEESGAHTSARTTSSSPTRNTALLAMTG